MPRSISVGGKRSFKEKTLASDKRLDEGRRSRLKWVRNSSFTVKEGKRGDMKEGLESLKSEGEAGLVPLSE